MATDLRRNFQDLIIFSFLSILWAYYPTKSAQSQETPSSCPQNLPDLTEQLLNDLPGYANRVIQRSRLTDSSFDNLYIILAGRPEFEPMPLQQLQYQSVFPNNTQQVFFTTLERHYRTNQAVTYQSYHWLFLTQADNQWYLVKVLSALASLNENDVPLPPMDTTNGAIGQGIRLWLRDCQFISPHS